MSTSPGRGLVSGGRGATNAPPAAELFSSPYLVARCSVSAYDGRMICGGLTGVRENILQRYPAAQYSQAAARLLRSSPLLAGCPPRVREGTAETVVSSLSLSLSHTHTHTHTLVVKRSSRSAEGHMHRHTQSKDACIVTLSRRTRASSHSAEGHVHGEEPPLRAQPPPHRPLACRERRRTRVASSSHHQEWALSSPRGSNHPPCDHHTPPSCDSPGAATATSVNVESGGDDHESLSSRVAMPSCTSAWYPARSAGAARSATTGASLRRYSHS